jgi:sortase A
MLTRNRLNRKSHRYSRKGILIGIPLLLFVSGIILLSIGTYKYFSYAFYLSRLFIHDEIKPELSSVNVLDNREPDDSGEEIRDSGNMAGNVDEASVDIASIQWPGLGDQFGSLIIESVSIDYPVYHGDRDEDLRKGIGHYNGSRFPGEKGNVVLSGHRNTVFKPLKQVEIGDSVIFETTYGKYEYVISDIRITNGNDKTIVEPSDTEKLTLYTCYPFEYIGNAPKRYVVTCSLVKGTTLQVSLAEEDKS